MTNETQIFLSFLSNQIFTSKIFQMSNYINFNWLKQTKKQSHNSIIFSQKNKWKHKVKGLLPVSDHQSVCLFVGRKSDEMGMDSLHAWHEKQRRFQKQPGQSHPFHDIFRPPHQSKHVCSVSLKALGVGYGWKQSSSDIEVVMTIDLEKALNYNSEVGWNWHKSWNLPILTVNLEVSCPKIPLNPSKQYRSSRLSTIWQLKTCFPQATYTPMFSLSKHIWRLGRTSISLRSVSKETARRRWRMESLRSLA